MCACVCCAVFWQRSGQHLDVLYADGPGACYSIESMDGGVYFIRELSKVAGDRSAGFATQDMRDSPFTPVQMNLAEEGHHFLAFGVGVVDWADTRRWQFVAVPWWMLAALSGLICAGVWRPRRRLAGRAFPISPLAAG